MSGPEYSVWTYPWDLHDIGVDQSLSNIKGVGLNSVSIATSYHAGRFLQAANPRRRVYFPEDGTVYYQPDPEIWSGKEIIPKQAAIVADEGDMLETLVRARDNGGPKVSCWTVCLHNSRLGMAHPDHVTRTAFGDPNYYALCPSSPEARDYVTTMVQDFTTRYKPDRVELESPDFMGFAHGFHHEKDGVGLLAEDEFLLSLCFCDHCRDRATAAGVDFEAARQITCTLLDHTFSRELPEIQIPGFPEDGPAAFANWPALHAYLEWRPEPVTSLIADIRAAADPATKILLIDDEYSWVRGVDINQIAPICDGVLLCVYTTPQDRIRPLMQEYRTALGPDKTLIAGFQAFHPEVSDATDLAARTAATTGLVDGVNFYNLGLIPASRLPWIKGAIDAA